MNRNLVREGRSNMDLILDSGINSYEFIPELWVFSNQNLRIPSKGNKESVNSTADWCHENLTELKSDQECKGHNDCSEDATLVIWWVCEFKIEIGEKGAEVSHKH